MINLPIKKIAGFFWFIIVFSFLIGIFALILASAVKMPRYQSICLATIGAGALFVAFSAYRGIKELKQGLMSSIAHFTQEIKKRGEYLHTTEKMATMGRLAAGVAHEIRNPLTSIKMRLFSLGRELQENSTQKEDLDVIKEEVNRLEEIVENFLRFARPTEVKLEPLLIGEILSSVIELLKHRFESQEIRVRIDESISNLKVMVDKQQIRQVFMNILLNACDALPDGGEIKIDGEIVERGSLPSRKKMARITIANSGPPIPPEDAVNIFEPFFSTRDEGTGLGLSIAKQIIEQHGGEIKLDEPVDGFPVRFTILLNPVEDKA